MEYSSRFRIAQFGFGVAIIILMMLIGHQSGAQLTASTNPKAAFSAQGTFDQSDRAVSRVSLSEEERDEIAAIAKDIPAVDLDIPFDIDSAAVSETAKPSLD